MKFEMMNEAEVKIDGEKISMRTKGGTNLFNGVSGTWKNTNFPFYYARIQGDFMVCSNITVDFQAVYDLGALVVFENENKWIKFAFENSDMGVPAIVSVVTRDTSDDCNGEPIQNDSVWLQICRQGSVFAMHYSIDKQNWKLARICRVDMQEEIMVGISVQCPTGNQCMAVFDELEIKDNLYEDIRNLKVKESDG
ncbi:MAG: DUF1349 domain-containing protein [Lachnospiraceae bacterium]|nr:DUF1349 domain-containing protein [Lachnospiraceae bacterium]